LEVAGDIAAAATALSGLLLVFLGAIANSFDSFEATSQRAVRKKYALRAWLVFVGFVASLIAASTAIAGKWNGTPWLVCVSAAALGASLLVILIAASLTAKDIR
jgi:hypothetical protein